MFTRCADAAVVRRLVVKTGVLVGVLLIGASLWAAPALAQHEVTGVVTDVEEGSTLPGVNIVVQGTQIGTISRSDGSFTIEAPSDEGTLVFSFVGYQEQEVPIEGREEINVELEPAVTALEEVVVEVGYGQQAVETITGSVSQASGEDLDIIPTTNLTQSLQGTIPGLIGVNSSGRPGHDDSDLLIRGSSTLNDNSPLVVIDGVPGRQGGLARLNPSDIESVSVLKDASAAIYGSRAANGVILVTTKRGAAGDAQININIERSYSQPTVVPEMIDSPTYMQMLNEVDQYAGNPSRYSQEEIEQHRNCPEGSFECFNTDWYETALRDFSRELTANASVSGGSETIRYRVSLEGITESGILVNSGTGYDQLGVRSNIDADPLERLSVGLNVHGRLENRELPAWTRGMNSAWELLQRGKPIEPAFWPSGEPGPAQEQGVNPVVASRTGYDDQTLYYIQSSLSLDFDVPGVEGWTAEGTVAYDHQFEDRKRFQKPWTLYNWDGSRDADGNPILTGASVGVPDPRLQQWDSSVQDLLVRATSTYEETVGSHTGRLLLGSEYQWEEGLDMWAFRRFFPTEKFDDLFAGGTRQQDLDGNSWHAARLNFFGRANYNYQQRYLLEFVARYDGSYIFPEGNRFGFFPSVSAGWRMAQEDWFNNLTNDVFSRMKLRASYGQVGNDRIEPYQYLRTFGLTGQIAFGNELQNLIEQTRVPNPNITWEVATKFDVGLQGAVLDERLSFDLTYFSESRDDILWFRDEEAPWTAGFTLPRENIGQVQSRGVEAAVSYSQEVASGVTLRAGANMTYAKDEIEFFAEPEGIPEWQKNEGRPMDTDLYFVADGIWSSQDEIDNAEAVWPGARPGDVRFEDINGDGDITGDDRVRIEENDRPDLIGSVNLGATVGRFDARFLFQGAAQVRHYVFTNSVATFGNWFQEFADQRWTPDRPDAPGPRAYDRNGPYWATNANTYFLRDAKYLRLKSAQLSYALPGQLTGYVGADQLQVYLSGRNLFTLTPLKVMDPEVRNGGAHTYPPERSFTFGIQMGF
jgi:TonB-linked SusC/RagA family outer membrane protein